jgi:hypothetical protein
MTSITSNAAALRPAHRTLWLLAAVFILPFIVGTGLFWSGWRPEKFVNHGELIQPPRPLPENGLIHADGRLFPTSELRGKWLLLLPVEGPCNLQCQQQLQQMQNVHLALNKEQSRLQRVFISKGNSTPEELPNDFPGLVIGVVQTKTAGKAWQSTLEGGGKALYVVDPLGNVMLHYTEPGDLRGVLKDLERLLKYSWIR